MLEQAQSGPESTIDRGYRQEIVKLEGYPLYVRIDTGPNLEEALLCFEDGEPDTYELAKFPSIYLARLFIAAMSASGVGHIPASFIAEFMAHRHFHAAKDIDIVARKDGKEYRLEGDWLKPFIATVALNPSQ